jgi:hypothetical protein
MPLTRTNSLAFVSVVLGFGENVNAEQTTLK